MKTEQQIWYVLEMVGEAIQRLSRAAVVLSTIGIGLLISIVSAMAWGVPVAIIILVCYLVFAKKMLQPEKLELHKRFKRKTS